MKMYTTLMSAYGASAGINYKFGGTVANTLQAHRMIQYFQEEKGPEVADKLVNSLYHQYFEEEKHPSSESTLLEACKGLFLHPSFCLTSECIVFVRGS
jgi:predicted DsbA family dithiol-disulfide isomerase